MRLIDESDVFVTNFLPAARRKLGIEPEDVLDRNPRIVYAPRQRPGTTRASCRSGWVRLDLLLGSQRRGDRRDPTRGDWPLTMPGPGFGDLQAGMALAGGIAAGLFQRERTGRGTVVDVSLLDGSLGDGHDDLRHQRARRRHPPPPVPRRRREPARQRLPHERRRASSPSGSSSPTATGRASACLSTATTCSPTTRFADAGARAAELQRSSSSSTRCSSSATLAEWQELLARQDGQWDMILPAGRVGDDARYCQPLRQRVEHDGDGDRAARPRPGPVRRDGSAARQGARPWAPTPTTCSAAWPRRDRHRRPARQRGVIAGVEPP